MSKYTTGEIAKLCDVTVRTVQYYDSRGLLSPSELSEGGRRLYSEDDLRQMKIICFLRELDLPINSIAELLKEEHPEKVISLLLNNQEASLQSEINDRQAKLDKLNELKRSLKTVENFSVNSIGDIAHIMENKKKLRKVRATMFAVGIPMDIIEIGTLILWITKGIWLPFAIGMCIVIVAATWLVNYYYKNIDYICPECHKVFKPKFKEMFFAVHTLNARKLTCPECGHRGYCVETYSNDTNDNK